MKYFTLLFICFFACGSQVQAAPELLIPLYTKHLQYAAPKDYNEGFNNTSIGVNWAFDHADVGTSWVFKNSHSRNSLYGYAIGYLNKTGVKFGGGIVAAAGGYDTPMIMSPILAVRYKWARVTTTYPLGKLGGGNFDVINVQLMIPFK